MSEFDEYDDDNDEQEQQQASNPMAELRKQNKLQAKQLKDMKAQFDLLAGEKRTRDLSTALTAAGIKDARAAKLVSAAGLDPTDENAVKGWLTEFGDLFGVVDEAKTAEADNTAEQLAKQSGFMSAGSGSGDAQASALNQLAGAKDENELRAFLKTQGINI